MGKAGLVDRDDGVRARGNIWGKSQGGHLVDRDDGERARGNIWGKSQGGHLVDRDDGAHFENTKEQ